MACRQSKRRRWRRFSTELYGRRKPAGFVARTVAEPLYRKPGLDERMRMWMLTEQGWSARAIARHLGRDHHTILRHLRPEWGEDLALGLALCGRPGPARHLVQRLGNSTVFATEVETYLNTFATWCKFERARIDAIANPCLTRRVAG